MLHHEFNITTFVCICVVLINFCLYVWFLSEIGETLLLQSDFFNENTFMCNVHCAILSLTFVLFSWLTNSFLNCFSVTLSHSLSNIPSLSVNPLSPSHSLSKTFSLCVSHNISLSPGGWVG